MHIYPFRDGGKIIWASNDTIKSTPALERSQEATKASYDDSDMYQEIQHKSCANVEANRDAFITNSDSDFTGAAVNAVDSSYSASSDVDVFYEAVNSFKQICKTQVECSENAALNGFVQMIIATIEGMSAAKQAKAMMRVTEVIMKIKIEKD